MQMCTLNNALLALIITWLLFLTVQQRPPLPGSSSLTVRSTDAREIRAAPTEGAGEAPWVGDDRQSWRFPPSATFLEGLRGCETLDCVRDAHALPHGDARYNFPHFMIAGYSKSATTSLYSYLTRHPDIIKPAVKESNFLTGSCQIQGYRLDCKPGSTLAYLNDMRISSFSTWKVKGQRASFDATPKVFDLGAQVRRCHLSTGLPAPLVCRGDGHPPSINQHPSTSIHQPPSMVRQPSKRGPLSGGAHSLPRLRSPTPGPPPDSPGENAVAQARRQLPGAHKQVHQ
jgi:hypothetical protein